MAKTLKPMAGYILAKDAENDKIGSFVIANDEGERESVKAIAVKCGSNYTEWNNGSNTMYFCPVNVSDVFYYQKYMFSAVSFNGERYKLVKFKDVIAVEE